MPRSNSARVALSAESVCRLVQSFGVQYYEGTNSGSVFCVQNESSELLEDNVEQHVGSGSNSLQVR